MSPGSATALQPRSRRPWKWILPVLAAAILAGYLAIIYTRIQRQAWQDETRPADAIVVFGAAEYFGRPSPVFRARLDHAQALFRRGIAPVIITTGGGGEDPRFTEGGVGRDYLISRGIPERNLIAETQSDNTAHSAERVAAIMRANGMRSCVAVSDGYHIFRIKKILADQGVAVYGAPRRVARPRSRLHRVWLILRETLSYAGWRLHLT